MVSFDVRRVLGVAATGVLATVMLACSSDSGPGSITVATFQSMEGYDDSLLVGTVEDRGGCLVIVADDAAYVPTFLEGSIVIAGEGDQVRISVPEQTFSLGDEISLGGSSIGTRDDPGVELPGGCQQDLPVWIVTPGGVTRT